MGANKSRLANASLKIEIDHNQTAFDGNHPITGNIRINVQETLPAYCVQMKLCLTDMSKKIDHGDKGQRYVSEKKLKAFEKAITVAEFENNIVPFGETVIPFTFEVPHDLPQSMHYFHSNYELYLRLKYFIKAQVVPVDTNLLNNEWGKSQLRDRQRILISPSRPIVQEPQFNCVMELNKQVGLMSSRTATLKATITKSFFLAGEMAYMQIEIDNTQCKDDCDLIVYQKMKVKQMQKSRKCDPKTTEKTETFPGPPAGQKSSMIIQFQIASRRRKPCKMAYIHHKDYYGLLSQ